jgi:outer membrane protein OmpA-like peptidoglycan-associated protein
MTKNLFKKSSVASVFIASFAIYFGAAIAAGVPHVVSTVDKIDANSVEFKEPSKAWRDEGIFPNLEAIAKMQPGLTKQEVYTAFGKPHFSEGFFGVRQWDYIFKFNVGTQIEVCQYQIRYSGDLMLSNTFWNRAECAEYALDNKNTKVVSEPQIVEKVVEKVVDRVVEKQITVNRLILQGDTLFGFGKSNINDILPGGHAQLLRLAKSIITNIHNIESIQITGHTDRLGSDELNAQLSLARANTIRDALVAQGLAATAFKTTGMGASKPIKICLGNQSELLIACLQDNRRVEIDISGLAIAQNNTDKNISTKVVPQSSQLSEKVHNLNAPEKSDSYKWTPISVRAEP